MVNPWFLGSTLVGGTHSTTVKQFLKNVASVLMITDIFGLFFFTFL